MKRYYFIFFIVISVIFTDFLYSCFSKKLCCKRDYRNNLECIEKCSYEFCPYSHPIEIR